MFRTTLLCLLGALSLSAADAPPKTAFDKPTLEAYVRHLYLLQPQLTVSVGDPKPSHPPRLQGSPRQDLPGRAIAGDPALRVQRWQEDRAGQLLRRQRQPLQTGTQ